MPTGWIGTPHDRYANLDKQNRRCDGNGRLCVKSANHMIWVIRAANAMDPFAVPEIKLTCTKHRQVFENNEAWKLIRTQRMPQKFTPQQLHKIPKWWAKAEIVGADDAARHAEDPEQAD